MTAVSVATRDSIVFYFIIISQLSEYNVVACIIANLIRVCEVFIWSMHGVCVHGNARIRYTSPNNCGPAQCADTHRKLIAGRATKRGAIKLQINMYGIRYRLQTVHYSQENDSTQKSNKNF